jgi:hypothetical protein
MGKRELRHFAVSLLFTHRFNIEPEAASLMNTGLSYLIVVSLALIANCRQHEIPKVADPAIGMLERV